MRLLVGIGMPTQPSRTSVVVSLPGRRRRLVLIAVTLACVALSIQKTTAIVLARSAPEIARKVDPGNALALATTADQQILANPVRNSPAAGALALQSLRRQGLNAYALRILGYAADTRGQSAKAAALIDLSAKISRRDRGSQIWLIEQAVRANDIPAALHHYDIALRTTDSSADLLVPILTGALDEPAVRTAFVPYARARPFWMEAFLAYAIAQSTHPERIAAMMNNAGALADPRNRELATRLIERLLVGGWNGPAQRIFLAVPGNTRSRLISPALDARDRTGADGAIGWRMLTTPVAQASLDAGLEGAVPVLHIEANGDGSGRMAEKALFLPPASYQFTARTASGRPEAPGTIQWRLECITAGERREAWTRESGPGDVVVSFTIGANCTQQMLSIDLIGQEGRQDASVDVSGIAIRPD